MAQTKEGAQKIAAAKLGLSIEEYLRLIGSGMKRCYHCREWKPVIEFGKDQTRGDGHAVKCFECVRVKERKSTKGRVSTFKGKAHSAEAKAKMSKARTEKVSPLKGKRLSAEMRAKISKATKERTARGQNHYAWKHGAKERNRDARRSVEYTHWRMAVFTRDRFSCRECGDARGGNLNAHHIKSFADFPELRFDVENGITLCDACHDRKHYKPDSIRNLRRIRKLAV